MKIMKTLNVHLFMAMKHKLDQLQSILLFIKKLGYLKLMVGKKLP